MWNQNMEPRDILQAIRDKYPKCVATSKTISNAIQKIKQESNVGETPMQILFSLLRSRQYVNFSRQNPRTKRVEEVFFVHSTSREIWRAFPHVILIDATYKTNIYKLPFVQIVGLTSTNKTFCIAFAFITQEKEDNFHWVLTKLKDTLQDCVKPRVIVTDCDKALMNACKSVFPHATKLICRWHIQENIARHCKQSLDNKNWAALERHWSLLINSPTFDIYNVNYNNLQTFLMHDYPSKVSSNI